MSNTETTPVTTTFADELVSLGEQYNDEHVRAEWRAQQHAEAIQFYLDTLLASDEAWAAFQDNARMNVRTGGKKTVSLLSWQGRGPSYQGLFLADLLDRDELLQKFQDVLDLKGGNDRFVIFKHPVTGSRTPRSYSLTVSWDESRFNNARDIIEGERAKAEQRDRRNFKQYLEESSDVEERRPQRRVVRREQGGEDYRQTGPPRRRNYLGYKQTGGVNEQHGPSRNYSTSDGTEHGAPTRVSRSAPRRQVVQYQD